mmetsp:Transcript_29807/g.55234  ORF Transcript_29807/g.55234 Transcript_29807/m.55234 type:complete len:228 (+) Transcript_29807:262-945(+)
MPPPPPPIMNGLGGLLGGSSVAPESFRSISFLRVFERADFFSNETVPALPSEPTLSTLSRRMVEGLKIELREEGGSMTLPLRDAAEVEGENILLRVSITFLLAESRTEPLRVCCGVTGAVSVALSDDERFSNMLLSMVEGVLMTVLSSSSVGPSLGGTVSEIFTWLNSNFRCSASCSAVWNLAAERSIRLISGHSSKGPVICTESVATKKSNASSSSLVGGSAMVFK